MKNYIILTFALGIISISCSKKEEIKATPLAENTTTSDAAKVDSGATLQINPNSPNVVIAPNSGTATTTPVTGKPVAAGMNPEHGKPGHRCDIPVGAPLNSAPSVTQAKSVGGNGFNTNPMGQSKSTNVVPDKNAYNIQPKPATTKTAPGMNPPHGEPNHRCDIAVGAPLNSPKGATTPPPATTVTPSTNTSASNLPATVAAPAIAKTVTAPDMNPPHGEPGHRCDISVGAPLK